MRIEVPRPSWLHRAVKRVASSRAGSWFLSRTLHHLDRAVARVSGGRGSLTALLAGLPVVTLTIVGARSGRPRYVPLVGIPEGEDVTLIASNWGRLRHPAWYYSLRAHPEVVLSYRGVAERYVAREVTGEEREACLTRAALLYSGYHAYVRRAGGRKVPVFVLSPERDSRRAGAGRAQPA